MPSNRVFRQAVLDRLATPEQLHSLMRITSARGWIVLLGCGLVVATAVVWGFLGRIPSKVDTQGILIHSGGLADVVALGEGQISSVEVDIGDPIERGQVVAQVAQPALAEQIKSLKARLFQLKTNFDAAKKSGGKDLSLRRQMAGAERKSLSAALAANETRKKELEERLARQKRLHEQGLITKDALQATRDSLRSIELMNQSLKSDRQRLAVDDFSARRANEVAMTSEQLQIQETERQIKLMEERFEQNSRIVSTHAGRVIEIPVMPGDVVSPGKPVLNLELTGSRGALEALLYVDSRRGKLLRPGMEVQIIPSVVKKERHGVLLGKVRSVDSFPSTRQGMMRVLHNEQLVQSLISETGGAPIGVRAALIEQAGTPSGYRWSSGDGPDVAISSGTRCSAYVTTRTQRPAGLVFPALDFD